MYEVTSWRLLGNILAGGKFVRNTSQGKEGEGEGCFFCPSRESWGKAWLERRHSAPDIGNKRIWNPKVALPVRRVTTRQQIQKLEIPEQRTIGLFSKRDRFDVREFPSLVYSQRVGPGLLASKKNNC
mmetsp:Transcript_75090/g.163872  ORF Transcript_75090/g.163872 Transcript_75090/m.163872 type:complete len:127 (-) Transcript_75090:79-459(-)